MPSPSQALDDKNKRVNCVFALGGGGGGGGGGGQGGEYKRFHFVIPSLEYLSKLMTTVF